MLDPFEARETITPPPADETGTRLQFVPIVGPGAVQGAGDDEAWSPAGYVGETGNAPVLFVDGHPVALPGADLAAKIADLESRLSALEA